MAALTFSKHVVVPPEQAFAAATDVPRWAENVRGIERIELLTDGPIGVGTRFRETRVMFGREATEEMEITAFDPPRGFTMQAYSCGAMFVSEHRFIPDSDGTRVELNITIRSVSWLAKLMSPLSGLMMGSMRKLIEADLEDLKAAAEKRLTEN